MCMHVTRSSAVTCTHMRVRADIPSTPKRAKIARTPLRSHATKAREAACPRDAEER